MKLLPLLLAVLFAATKVMAASLLGGGDSDTALKRMSVSDLISLPSLPVGKVWIRGRITRVIHKSALMKGPTKIELDGKLRCEVVPSKSIATSNSSSNLNVGMTVDVTGVFVRQIDGVMLKGDCMDVSDFGRPAPRLQ